MLVGPWHYFIVNAFFANKNNTSLFVSLSAQFIYVRSQFQGNSVSVALLPPRCMGCKGLSSIKTMIFE